MNHSAELCQAFFNTTEDWIFVIEAESQTIAEASDQAIKDTGYTLEGLQTLPIERLLRHRDGATIAILSGDRWGGDRSHGLRFLKKNGEFVSVNTNTIWFKRGLARYALLIIRKTEEALPCIRSEDGLGSERESFPTIIGRSIKIRDVCRLIGSSAKSDVTVLIQGESGTGKEIIANAVHAHSHRGRGPLVKVNCAALTESLLESELFGHVKGAFTGAIRDRRGRFKQADGGTIFLDEICSMSLAGQAKLLRVMQEHEFEPVGSSTTVPVDVRVIAATNTDLAKAVTEGKFREDLYYRLNVFPIALPPLRERKEDIAFLAQHFLHQYNQMIGKRIQGFTSETMSLFVKHDWPGNVRELENAVEHAVIVEDREIILPDSLPTHLTKSRKICDSDQPPVEPGLRDKLNALEKQILIEALVRSSWIKKQAAVMLGIDARNLPYLLRKHDLDRASVGKHGLH